MSTSKYETISDMEELGKKWIDWKWQLRHSIRDIDTFEKLLGVTFDEEERRKLEQTLEKFPLSITPYYLSLINREHFRNDPIYKQAFPQPKRTHDQTA